MHLLSSRCLQTVFTACVRVPQACSALQLPHGGTAVQPCQSCSSTSQTHRRGRHRAPSDVNDEVQPSLPVHVHEHAGVRHLRLSPQRLVNMHAVAQQAAAKALQDSLQGQAQGEKGSEMIDKRADGWPV